MSLFTREQFGDPDDEAGIMIDGLGRALVIWTAMQHEDHSPVTVAEAAKAFNTTPAVIREAISESMWAVVEGPDDDPTKERIELDGA